MDVINAGRLGIICTTEEYARSLVDPTAIQCLTRGESIGLTIVCEAGLLSLVAVSYIYTIILRNMAWRLRCLHSEKLVIFHQPMDLLMFSLFSADLLQGIGAVMDIRWIHLGKVEVGSFCTSQGIIQQLGETGVGMTTLLIAVYTFLGIWIGKNIRSVRVTGCILAVVWTFIVLMVALGNATNKGKHYESPTPYWCWIGQGYLQWRIWGEYIWFWITLVVSFFIYIPLYFWSRGNINIDDKSWWRFSFQRSDPHASPTLKVVRRQALAMLAYPVVYCISILPLSIVRWITFVHPDSVSSTGTFVVTTIFGLSGAANAVLLLTTRPNSGLFSKTIEFTSGRAPSVLMQELGPMHDQNYSDRADGSEYHTHDDDSGLGRLPSRN
ncbi:hypothetical protein BDN70DRAFT_801951 [Pholiota conissans]|uniref:Glucose receptor Git3 N-terminal domain-containing protein n=1 Tax=Pholiota conissans TaxID=109636 RepID=A0A9P5Z7U9_9AGAR|nr:hypothetical protein BDN70DRAFT_801951 [Pholiota conissans]